MNIRHVVLSLAAMVGLASTAAAQQPAGFWTKPAIKDFGPVHVWPEAVVRPDAKTTYKAVFDVTQGSPTSDKVNPGLDHVARTVNVFAAAGTPLSHLKFAVIIHGGATPIALDDKTFQAKFGHPNPDLAVIEALKKAGVELLVCGNALGDMQYTPAEVNPSVKVALSALSTLIILQNEGYALIRM
ncbi:MAG: DsrE family protein [Gemmatimonadaceae bacterium]